MQVLRTESRQMVGGISQTQYEPSQELTLHDENTEEDEELIKVNEPLKL